jgi:hypothetical protein
MTEAIVLPQRFSVVRHPELRRLVRYYRDACAGGRMISREALDPMLLKTVLPRVFYYDYDAEADDFRLRLAGEEVRAALYRPSVPHIVTLLWPANRRRGGASSPGTEACADRMRHSAAGAMPQLCHALGLP